MLPSGDKPRIAEIMHDRVEVAYYDAVGTAAQLAGSGAIAYYLADRLVDTAVAGPIAVAMVFAEFVATIASRYAQGSLEGQFGKSFNELCSNLMKRTIVQLVVALPLALVGSLLGELATGASLALIGSIAVPIFTFMALRIATIAVIGVIILAAQASEWTLETIQDLV